MEKCGPRAAVDAVGDAGRVEPFLPGVAVGDEVHRVVVQQHVVRQVCRLRAGLSLTSSGLATTTIETPNSRSAAVAGILAQAEVDLDARDVVAQVERSRSSPRCRARRRRPSCSSRPRAPRSSGSRLEKSARRGISQRAVNTGGAVIARSVSPPRSRICSTAAASASKPSRSRGSAGARRLGELHAAPRAAEQFHTEVFLEALDLVADRRLRDGKLVRGLLEGKMARGGLEYP